jgi:3-isopropylmalate/(R)-2-methylmalate dehydratase small subunit
VTSGLETVRTARAWVVGDSVDTNQLAGGGLAGATAQETLRINCLRVLRPEFPAEVQPGDVVVAGENFGCGSSRQTAVEALIACRVGAVVAESVARIFRRNSIALAFPLFVAPGVRSVVMDGDDIAVHYADGVLMDHTRNATLPVQRWSRGVEEIYAGGGLSRVIAVRLSAIGHPPHAA